MDRLTKYMNSGMADISAKTYRELAHHEAIQRLAAYEDTGLTPEEISAIQNENSRLAARVEQLEAENEKLTALAQNGQSAIDTNMRIIEKINGLKEENEQLRAERDAAVERVETLEAFVGCYQDICDRYSAWCIKLSEKFRNPPRPVEG